MKSRISLPPWVWAVIGSSPLVLFIFAWVVLSPIQSSIERGRFLSDHVNKLKKIPENNENLDGIHKYVWEDQSYILTSFAEGCSGCHFEIYIVKFECGAIYDVEKIHFCGAEGMKHVLAQYKNAAEFLDYCKLHGRLICSQEARQGASP